MRVVLEADSKFKLEFLHCAVSVSDLMQAELPSGLQKSPRKRLEWRIYHLGESCACRTEKVMIKLDEKRLARPAFWEYRNYIIAKIPEVLLLLLLGATFNLYHSYDHS